MNSFHKIFFVVVVILSVAAGNYFNGAGNSGNVASIIVSAADEKPQAENSLSTPAETVQPTAPNNSTTPNDIKAADQPDALTPVQDDNSKTVLNNDALMRPELSAATDAFRKTGSDAPPEIQAKAAIVADLKTGKAYFELNPNLRWPTASLTKLMTAIMVLKNMDLSRPIKVGEGLLAVEEASTSAGFFKPGDVYSGTDTLATMLVISKNEAAEAFASAYGRSDFIAGLNKLAAEFGMSSTNFSDPSGLSVSNQSTISDLEKLAYNVYQSYPKIFDITKKKSVSVTETGSKKRTALSNINIFAGTSGFIGGKTGYTDEANGNLLSVFSYGNRPVLTIVMGTDDRFGETGALLDWFKKNYK